MSAAPNSTFPPLFSNSGRTEEARKKRTTTTRAIPSFSSSSFYKTIFRSLVAGTLSFGLLITVPSPFTSFGEAEAEEATEVAVGSKRVPIQTRSKDICKEEEVEEVKLGGGIVTNEEIVEEAWEVVNENFLDAGNRGWTPENWMQMKNDALSGRIQSRSKAHTVIQRMLSNLHDPYTRFLSSSEFSRMAKYDLTGIGINLREVPGESGDIKLKVLGIIFDGPAHSAGIRQGDELLSVNGVDMKGKSAFEVSSLLQGPAETFVTIETKHGDCGTAQIFKVQRKQSVRTPVFYRLENVDNGAISVGYLRLKEFNALAQKDLITAMKRLQESGALWFVLDLRDNLGGLVQAGIEVSKLFLNEGDTVIYTGGRDPQVLKNIVSETPPMFTSPLIILVNNRTASASEIVAASLHDNCKAVLVGERTFGKGLIQSIFELHDGSGVVVTIGKYITPNHYDINKNGIEPDFSQIPALSEVKKHLMQCQIQKKG